jgi:hypothetical protein
MEDGVGKPKSGNKVLDAAIEAKEECPSIDQIQN